MANKTMSAEVKISVPIKVEEWFIRKSEEENSTEFMLMSEVLADYVESQEKKEEREENSDLVNRLMSMLRRY